MKISKINLRALFAKGLKPTQEAFYNWMDSYWHKDDLIDISAVKTLQNTLDNKLDLSVQNTLLSAFEDAVSTVVSGIKGEAFPASSPTPYDPGTYPNGLYEKWDVKTAGTYIHFIDASSNPIEVTSAELVSNLVQFSVSNGVAKKNTTQVVGGTVVSAVFDPTTETEAQGGKQIAERYDDKVNLLITTKTEIVASYNSCTWVDASYYNPDGSIGSSVNTFSRITNYITVIAGDTYIFANSGTSIIWYDINQNVIGSSGNPMDAVVMERPFIAPIGAKFARINILTTNKNSFSFQHKPLTGELVVKKGVIKLSDIDGVSILYVELANYASCTWISGQYLKPDGSLGSLSTFNYSSNYIAVEANKYYTFKSSGTAVIWYDINHNVIGFSGDANDASLQRNFLAPNGAKFARVNQHNENIQSFSFRVVSSDGGSDLYKIPNVQIDASQIVGGLTGTGSEQAKLSKIGDVKMFNFNSNILTGNAIISGDSTIAAFAGGTAIADILKFSGTVTNIAVPGETIAQQVSHWNALSSSIRSSANFVFVQIGLNDLGTGSPSTEITIQALKDYFAIIRTDSPTAIIVAGEMLPCKQRFINLWGSVNGDVAYQKWKAMNAALPTIAGVNKVATVHGWLLNDGNDNLKSEFDTGDAIHETTIGRKMISYSWLISVL
ncbi:hypothetical protein GCM10022217_15670 [Chryseobacterium ginsenosidimutans]|uniref:SGNH/GDSL hydrolase family protein n=1 Tax=Chryseobacterium ginsenosidimutans TaxID=687846 RepID=UPI0031D5A217